MDDDDSNIPLHHMRPFGAGLKRKRIEFVRAQSPEPATGQRPSPASVAIADVYLDLVLPKHTDRAQREEPLLDRCEVCFLPREIPRDSKSGRAIDAAHEASLVHQVCLPHSRPPSSLDRTRKGFVYLESHGWDPDAGLGLGPDGTGIQFPLKAREKLDTLGLGFQVQKSETSISSLPRKKKLPLLDAKACLKLEREDRRKTERLRQRFYGNDDVERYLGSSDI